MTQLPFLIAVATLFATLCGVAIYFLIRTRRASRTTWMALLNRLNRIDRDTFATVALDLLEDRATTKHLDPDQIFDMVGGMDGLTAVEQNCDVLIDIATYVHRWYPEALDIAEELRLNSREIKWHIGRLRGAAQTGHLRDQFPIYAQRAIATYYLMTRSLLVLYEGVQLPFTADLQQAI